MSNLCIKNLEEINFFKPKEKKPIMLENLRNIFYRMDLSSKETRILSGVFANLGKKTLIDNLMSKFINLYSNDKKIKL